MQVTVLCLLASHVVLNLLPNVQWLKLVASVEPRKPGHDQDHFVKLSQVSEICVLVSGIIAPSFCFIWPRFREEASKIFCLKSEVTVPAYGASRSHSVISFR